MKIVAMVMATTHPKPWEAKICNTVKKITHTCPMKIVAIVMATTHPKP